MISYSVVHCETSCLHLAFPEATRALWMLRGTKVGGRVNRAGRSVSDCLRALELAHKPDASSKEPQRCNGSFVEKLRVAESEPTQPLKVTFTQPNIHSKSDLLKVAFTQPHIDQTWDSLNLRFNQPHSHTKPFTCLLDQHLLNPASGRPHFH